MSNHDDPNDCGNCQGRGCGHCIRTKHEPGAFDHLIDDDGRVHIVANRPKVEVQYDPDFVAVFGSDPGPDLRRPDPRGPIELRKVDPGLMVAEPPYDQLDAGIRTTVRLLWDAGFIPVDSGDGVSKLGSMDCAIGVPHVFMRCEPDLVQSEAERLLDLVREWRAHGLHDVPDDEECEGGAIVQYSGSPCDGQPAVLMLFGVRVRGVHESDSAAVRS